MLAQLLGSKSAAEILLFLLVNQKCYPTQVAQALSLPLTPIQKALNRLEKAGIVHLTKEGRTNLYQFNPSYPLKNELEKLLQRTFSLLPPEKKERYPYFLPKQTPKKNNDYAILDTFWRHLKSTTTVIVRAVQKNPETLPLNGEGKVTVKPSGNTLIFEERGIWKAPGKEPLHYHNTLKWTHHYAANLISLEHLRYGADHPCFMFYLYPKTDRLLESTPSHLSTNDTFFGTLSLEGSHLKLTWKAIGHHKNESIETIYS